LVLQLKIN